MSRAHRPKGGFWIRLCVLIIYPLDSMFFKIRWHHLDRIPAKGGVLLAMNHISQADTLAAARMVWQSGRIPRFLIKASVFSVPVIATMMTGAEQIPVARGTRDATQALQAAIDAMKRGECVIIYPEGTITQEPDYWPMQAKTGVARIALACPELPIIPIGQWGAQQTLGRGGRVSLFPRKAHEASVGHRVDLKAYQNRPADNETLRLVTDEIMRAVTAEVAQLRSGQPPVEQFPWTPPPGARKRALRRARRRSGPTGTEVSPGA